MAVANLTDTRLAVERGDISPVYYLTGQEDVLKDEFVRLVVEHAVDAGSRDFNVDMRSATDLDAEALNALVETPPMLADRRVAVVRNCEQWRKNSKPWKTLRQYLSRPSPTTALVLVQAAGQEPDEHVAQHSIHLEAEFADASDLRAWAETRATELGLRITPDGLDHLIEATGHNLSRVLSEMEKLAAASSGEELDASAVGEYVGVHRGETLGDWIDAAIGRDVVRATGLLEVVLQQSGITGVRLVMNLGTALLGTRLVRAHLDAGVPASRVRKELFQFLKRARIMGIGRYSDEVGRWLAAAGRWSAPELDAAIEEAYRADQQLKSSSLSDEHGTLTSMLLTCMASERPK